MSGVVYVSGVGGWSGVLEWGGYVSGVGVWVCSVTV